jgi:hypothetical protein
MPGQPAPVIPVTIGCFITPDMLAFASGGSQVATSLLSTAEQDVNTWLPSFNLKLDLTDSLVFRFGASRALARPDMGYLKNFTSVGITYPSTTDATDPRWIKDSSGVINRMNPTTRPTLKTRSSNPPRGSDRLHLGELFLRRGFSLVGVVLQEVQQLIQYGSHNREVTLNGVTNTVEVRPDSRRRRQMSGYEVAFQRYFASPALRWAGHAGELHLR